jgi:uncharacterized SAM-binding protein YcdF (DUF218 family)
VEGRARSQAAPDVRRRARRAGGARALLGTWGIPEDRLLTRRISNCTFVEVRALRNLCAEAGVRRLVVITHAYHAPRSRTYLEEVLPGAEVVPAREAEPAGLDLLREKLVESALRAVHALDKSGAVERALANLVRARAPRDDG